MGRYKQPARHDGSYRLFSPLMEQAIAKRVTRGANMRQMAKDLGVSVSTIHKICKENSVSGRRGRPRKEQQ